jgi:2-polyprenyl-6-methoxyphenol hydroxylase-like FAD-dependent oxidoreductase
VYERDTSPEAREEGFRLHLNPAGVRSLRACLPEALWRVFLETAGNPAGGFGFVDRKLSTLTVVDEDVMYPAGDDPAERWYPVDRLGLRRLLLTGLDDTVHFGKSFERYETRPDGRVLAHFADGTSAVGDVLVGADGARSTLRARYLPRLESVDSGAVGCGLKLPLTPENRAWLPPRLASGENIVLSTDPFFLFTSVYEAAGSDGYVLCAFVCRRDAFPGFDDVRGTALRAAVAAKVAHWHPDYARLISACDPGQVLGTSFSVVVPDRPWTPTAVTLLGDAAHVMPPTGGLGANTALRDSRLLARELAGARPGGHVAAVGAYERRMREYGSAAVRSSLANLKQGLGTNPATLAVFRTLLRLCAAAQPVKRLVFAESWAKDSNPLDWEKRAGGANPVGTLG